jgi:2-methylcitrate dehydratase PrpD
VIGGRRAGPQAATLANGPAGAILEMDDVDKRALLHPGPVVLPAALAAAEASGATDGAAFLDAVVRGYEAMIRVGRAAGAGHYRFFHATGTCGPFGAAAAAASILQLDPRATAWALANAGQQSTGLWQARHEPVFTKAFHDGRAAANGLAAAFLAREGFAGPLTHFEGPQGFFAALCDGADPEAVVAGPGEGWAIHEVSFKPHAACRHAHAAIDAVLDLRAQAAGRDLQSLEVASYRDALAFCDKPNPTTPGEAKFSLQHAAAVAWIHGDADLPRFTLAAIADPDHVAFRARVTVAEDPAITARYPARFGASARAILADGTVLETQALDALGDPERPLDPAGLDAKASALMAWGGLDSKAAGHLVSVCLGLGDTSTIADLSAALPGLDA